MADSPQKVLRSAKQFLFGTMLSRLSGFFRDMAMAFYFGSSPEVASFMVAYRLANLFRRMFGEGNIQAGFIPAFEKERLASERQGALFYRDTAFSLGFLLLGVVLAMEGGLYAIRPYLNPGWSEIATLAMWMTPGLWFICLYGLHGGVLQCKNESFWTGVAPVVFNAGWIVAACAAPFSTQPMLWLSIGVTGSYGLQWWVTKSRVKRLFPFGNRGAPRFFSPSVRDVLKPMGLGILGVSAVQINSALDAIFARLADPSGPAYLWYAIRVEQLPLALFGIALSGALLPPLTRAMQQKSLEEYQQLLRSALSHSLALILPCTFGLLALGRTGLNLLYGRGDFQGANVDQTLLCLWGYGMGLIPSVFILLLAQGFYAKKEYRIPTLASLTSVGVNVLLNTWMVLGCGWGAFSIAVSTSLSAWINYAVLAHWLPSPSPWKGSFIWRYLVACALPALASLYIQAQFFEPLPRGLGQQMGSFGVSAAIYLLGFLGLVKRLYITEFFDLFRGERREA